jgi:hypothetical protein
MKYRELFFCNESHELYTNDDCGIELLNIDLSVQVCDARDDAICTVAGNTIKKEL